MSHVGVWARSDEAQALDHGARVLGSDWRLGLIDTFLRGMDIAESVIEEEGNDLVLGRSGRIIGSCLDLEILSSKKYAV